MTLHDHQFQFAQDVGRLIKFIQVEMLDHTFTLGEVYRTPEQAEIYFKEGKGIKDSLHCKKLAIDIQLFYKGEYLTKSEDYARLGCFWESLDAHNRWGGIFGKNGIGGKPDGNHFERRPN